ncbi:Conserved oligomeric Golgi complex subunit 2 [Mortierella sp. AM989]|nr:Conserved oligomeric Golgi complex subunit 2 [Mortierella sp. AM989]
MSNEMLRSMYKGKPPPLPPQLDDNDNDNDEEIGELHDRFSSLPAIHPTKMNVCSVSDRYAPLDWKDYFESKRLLTVPGESESEVETTFNIFETQGKPGAPLFVMHHGAGLCALSFALTAREIRKAVNKDASILSFDCRGHGETRSGDEHNLSLDRLAKDLRNVIHAASGEHAPDIILVGHSMGGAVVSEAASRGMIQNLIGIAILDVVEGVAIETLSHLNGWLERRPSMFRSLDKVVQWGIKSGTVRNIDSARVSLPPLVVLSNESTAENPCYVWRTDLAASEQYWKEWFTGLTQKFLSSRAGKLLVLAGTDRLDKDMTIAQMQGKFQMLVFPNSGHSVQEDEPNRMARELIAFWKRNERLCGRCKTIIFVPANLTNQRQMVASSGANDSIWNGIAASQQSSETSITGTTIAANGAETGSTSQSRKPSHLSIDSTTANSAFLHTLNSQLQIAANNQNYSQRHQNDSVSSNDFPLAIGLDRAALIAANFDTDEFLSARRHLPLEELKSQLIAHMKELKIELIELINSDYADFINLSTNLNGVDRMMDDLQKPLDRMKGDAIAVKSNLQLVVESLEQKLQRRAEIREKKASLQLLLNISESVAKVEGLLQISSTTEAPIGLRHDSEGISVAKRLERVAIEYNQMQYLVSKGAGLPFVTNIDWRLVRIKETMSENLSTVLRTCILPPQQSEESALSNKDSLSQCLRTYALIDQTVEAEKVITDDLLAPFIKKAITRSALSDQSHAKQSNSAQLQQRSLVIMYSHVLSFIDTHCTALINVTQKELKGTNFDIPVNCIWGITTNTILQNIPHILTPGIPDDFHRNYMDTMDFVSKLEELCGSRKSLTRLRSQASYQAFMKRWQLPAYFQLRFRDISMSVEDAFQMNVDSNSRVSSSDAHLPASMAVIRAIERCWSSDVFIYGIAFSFWKFTLQLMARYSIWITTNLSKDLDLPKERSVPSRTSSPALGSSGSGARQQGRSTPAPGGPLRLSGPVGRTSLEEAMLQQLTMIVNDIDHVFTKIQEIFDQQIRPKLPSSIAEEPVLAESFEQNLQAIRQDVPGVQQRITDLITKHCIEVLVNVKNINARASEGVPREASHFVPLILAPLSKYIAGSGSVLKNESREAWSKEVIVATTNQYSTILEERLTEAKLLEERTNKVKAAAPKSRLGGILPRAPILPNAFSSAGSSEAEAKMSTNDKLRLQCVLDVKCYKSELAKFAIDPDTFQPFLDLQTKVHPYENLLETIGQN